MSYWGREVRDLLERLEGKLSRAVLRGPRGSNVHSATRPFRTSVDAPCSRSTQREVVGYDRNEPFPDHSSLTKLRTRYGIEVFHRFIHLLSEQED